MHPSPLSHTARIDLAKRSDFGIVDAVSVDSDAAPDSVCQVRFLSFALADSLINDELFGCRGLSVDS